MKQLSNQAYAKLLAIIMELPFKVAHPVLKFLEQEVKDVTDEPSNPNPAGG